MSFVTLSDEVTEGRLEKSILYIVSVKRLITTSWLWIIWTFKCTQYELILTVKPNEKIEDDKFNLQRSDL